jgi:hypothetical protein
MTESAGQRPTVTVIDDRRHIRPKKLRAFSSTFTPIPP